MSFLLGAALAIAAFVMWQRSFEQFELARLQAVGRGVRLASIGLYLVLGVGCMAGALVTAFGVHP